MAVRQGKFVFFDLKDETGSVSCFMMVWQLRVALEDGMQVAVQAVPKLTARGKFSLTVQQVRPVGQGSIKKNFELLRQRYDLPLIFMTGHGDVGMAVARMKLGAVDFLEKPFDDKQLISTVENAFNQARVKQNDAQRREQRQELLARLTPREQQVLELIAAGRLNKQIAGDLNISIKTVEAHRANIMDKFEVRTMADLMRRFLGSSPD